MPSKRSVHERISTHEHQDTCCSFVPCHCHEGDWYNQSDRLSSLNTLATTFVFCWWKNTLSYIQYWWPWKCFLLGSSAEKALRASPFFPPGRVRESIITFFGPVGFTDRFWHTFFKVKTVAFCTIYKTASAKQQLFRGVTVLYSYFAILFLK